jgi:hypothetical protein
VLKGEAMIAEICKNILSGIRRINKKGTPDLKKSERTLKIDS